MDIRVDVRLNGLEEALEQAGPKLARSHLRKAMRESMLLIEEDARMRAPIDTGALVESIKTLVVTNANQESGRATVGPTFDPGLKKSGSDMSQSPGVYGLIVEFGLRGKKNRATPFMRPAYDSQADKVVAKFADILKEGLEALGK